MTTISQLKATYNLSTASDLPPNPKPPDDHERVRIRWSQDKKHAFKVMAPAAMCIVATEGPVSVTTYDALGQVKKRFGHNRGCWPMRVATTSSWGDHISEAYDKNPFVETRVQIRIWCKNEKDRDSLALKVAEMLGVMAEEAMGAQLRKSFHDVGPEIDLTMLEMQIHALAERIGIVVWDDDGLSAHLDRLVRRADEMKFHGR